MTRPDDLAAAWDYAIMQQPDTEFSPFERDLAMTLAPILARLCAVPVVPLGATADDRAPSRRGRRARQEAA